MNIRGVPRPLLARLKAEAKHCGLTLREFVLQLLDVPTTPAVIVPARSAAPRAAVESKTPGVPVASVRTVSLCPTCGHALSAHRPQKGSPNLFCGQAACMCRVRPSA